MTRNMDGGHRRPAIIANRMNYGCVQCVHASDVQSSGPMVDADSPLAWTLYLADNRRDILRLLAGIISHMPKPPEGLRDSSQGTIK